MIQKGSISSGIVTSVFQRTNSTDWVLIGEDSGYMQLWVWNPSTAKYEYNSTTPAAYPSSIYLIVVDDVYTSEMREDYFVINSDNSISQLTGYYLTNCGDPAYGFSSNGASCTVDCSKAPFATTNLSPTVCNCQPGYYWV